MLITQRMRLSHLAHNFWPCIAGLIIAVMITGSYYLLTVVNQKEQTLKTLNNSAINISERVDQMLLNTKVALMSLAALHSPCHGVGRSISLDTLTRLPYISDLEFIDKHNVISCSNWSMAESTPSITNRPASNFWLFAPLFSQTTLMPSVALNHIKQDHGFVRAIISHQQIKNNFRTNKSYGGFTALVDKATLVPIVLQGNYTLPIQDNRLSAPKFFNSPQVFQGRSDLGENYIFISQPMSHLTHVAMLTGYPSAQVFSTIVAPSPILLVAGLAIWCFIWLIFAKLNHSMIDPDKQLRQAIRSRQLFNVYQPIVCCNTQKTIGCEVLIRWQHPSKGLLMPATFIPLAEETTSIRLMTLIQIEQIIQELKPILRINPEFRVAINICAAHLEDIQTIKSILHAKVQLPGMSLEITENQLIQTQDTHIKASLALIQASGVPLALDDFGTGYCSLAYLSQLPVNILKADRAFLAALNTDAIHREVLSTISDLASKMHFESIAEGVETPEQAEKVKELGYTFAQGWYFGYPTQAHDFIQAYITPPKSTGG